MSELKKVMATGPYKILAVLATNRGPVTISQIQKYTGLDKGNISRHLLSMRRRGLIEKKGGFRGGFSFVDSHSARKFKKFIMEDSWT